MDPATMNNTRRFRRLYFGNLPLNLGLTEANFQQIVWQEMATRGLCIDPKENPILCVWFAQKKGNYGFIEFRTVEETERALYLDGFNCMGSKIKVSRPNDYSQAILSSSGVNSINQNQIFDGTSMIFSLDNNINSETAFTLGQQIANILLKNHISGSSVQLDFNSKIMRIINVIKDIEIFDITEYEEIEKDMCHGTEELDSIISSRIIKPNEMQVFEKNQEFKKNNVQINIADVFIEFKSNSNLQKSISIMSLKKYDNKTLNMETFNEELYYKYLKIN